LGNGLWILLLVPHLANLPSLISAVLGAAQTGLLPADSLVAASICLILAVALVATLARPIADSGMRLDRVLIWPLFIASWLSALLLSVPLLVPPDGATQDMAASLLNPQAPLYLIALAVIVILISLAQWRRLIRQDPAHRSSSGRTELDPLPVALTALALAALAVLPPILTTYLDVPILMNGRLIAAMVIIALTIQDLLQNQEAGSARGSSS
jgi:hypothetical protein